MRDRAPTAEEAEFFNRLVELIPSAQDSYYADEDGTPSMTASYEDMVNGFVEPLRTPMS